MFYDTILHLCELNGKKITNVIAELDISAGNPSKWKSGNVPKEDTLTKLADYFHVSVDYLLGRDSPSGLSLSPEEEELVRCYRLLNNDGKKKMNDYLDDLLGNEKNLSVPAKSGASAG